MANREKVIGAAVDMVTREAADSGKLIELGWKAQCALLPLSVLAQPLLIEQMRNVYYAGAQHLWSCMMRSALDPGAQETDGDVRRFSLIADELDTWAHRSHMTMGQTDKFTVRYIGKGEPPRCPPRPEFPNGEDVDVVPNGMTKCKADLPYPAPGIGAYHIRCNACGVTLGITVAGRPDDPRSVAIPCQSITATRN